MSPWHHDVSQVLPLKHSGGYCHLSPPSVRTLENQYVPVTVPAPLCRSLREYLISSPFSPLLTNNYTKHTNYQETELQPVTHQASPSG